MIQFLHVMHTGLVTMALGAASALMAPGLELLLQASLLANLICRAKAWCQCIPRRLPAWAWQKLQDGVDLVPLSNQRSPPLLNGERHSKAFSIHCGQYPDALNRQVYLMPMRKV